MISFQKKEHGLIRRYLIVGGRRLSNFWWSTVIFLGGCGFLFTGISSFFNRNLLLITPPEFGTGVSTPKIEHVTRLNKKSSTDSFELSYTQSDALRTPKGVSKKLIDYANKSINFGYIKDVSLRGHDNPINNLPCKASLCMYDKYNSIDYSLLVPPVQSKGGKKSIDSFELSYMQSDALRTPKGVSKKLIDYVNNSFSSLNVPNIELTKLKNTITLERVTSPMLKKRGSFMELATLRVCIGDLSLKIIDGIPILPFFPQGLVLSFYGFLGLWFSFHLWFTLLWKIGAGFNEVNGKEKSVRIFRWGRPGKNRRIDLKYSNELIETIKIELFPKPALFLCIKGDKKIPLTRLGEFIPLEELETQAAELTSLLQVPLEIEELST